MRGRLLGLVVLCGALRSEGMRATAGLGRPSAPAQLQTTARARSVRVFDAAAPYLGEAAGSRVRFRQVAERFRQWRADVHKIIMSEEDGTAPAGDPAAAGGRETMGAPFAPADSWPSPSIRVFAADSRVRLRDVCWLLLRWVRGKLRAGLTALAARSPRALKASLARIASRGSRR